MTVAASFIKAYDLPAMPVAALWALFDFLLQAAKQFGVEKVLDRYLQSIA